MPAMVIRQYETDEFLESFDPDVHAPGVPFPTGYAVWTDDIRKAMIFASAGEAIKFFRTQSKVTPFRPDGRPNCPLTAFSVSFDTFQEAERLKESLDKAKSDASRKA